LPAAESGVDWDATGFGTFASFEPAELCAAAMDATKSKQPHTTYTECKIYLRFHPAVKLISHSFGVVAVENKFT
jgi:hypothetical protein